MYNKGEIMKEVIKNNLVTVLALGTMGVLAMGWLVVMGIVMVITALAPVCPVV